MHTLSKAVLGGSLLLCSSLASASPLQWQNNSLTYLVGSDFQVDPKTQQTVTFEHVSGWSFGDLFFFVDSIHYNGGRNARGDNSSWYGELSPRFSLGKLSGQAISFGPVKDVLLATTWEFGRGDLNNYLVGPGFDLAVPGFDFVQLNTYYRRADTPDGARGVWQITPVWAWTQPLGKSDLLIDGFIDWVVDNDSRSGAHANFKFNPQVKYDLGKAMDWSPKQLYVGVEYDYWKNKYGIKDSSAFKTDQSATNLIVKLHF